ncbi:MAG: DUF1273 family protein [Clostridia bacterium]|nr:DUF1273 family protein [Clostridia bacterium]
MYKELGKCCCFGHRPQGFAYGYENKTHILHKKYLRTLEYLVEEQIQKRTYEFLCGATNGAELDFAEIVLNLREKYPHIRLKIVLAYPEQYKSFNEIDKQRYIDVLRRADTTLLLSPRYTKWCMQKRNRYLVENAFHVIAVWNGSTKGGTYNTIKYAQSQLRFIDVVSLPALCKEDLQKAPDFYFLGFNSVEDRIANEQKLRQEVKEMFENYHKTHKDDD